MKMSCMKLEMDRTQLEKSFQPTPISKIRFNSFAGGI